MAMRRPTRGTRPSALDGEGAPVPPILPPVDGFLLLDRAKFHVSFAADVPDERATFIGDSQVPWCLGLSTGR
jgi:hypothetical protein